MWRRVSTQLQTLVSWRSVLKPSRSIAGDNNLRNRALLASTSPFQGSVSLFRRHVSSGSDDVLSKEKKRVEDVMPIATGHEREELEAELKGMNILDIDYPVGHFGTKAECPILCVVNVLSVVTEIAEEPFFVKSYYDKRIVGCPGGEGEDEHDVVWFWLEKDKPHECPVCSQYFMLEVVGPGGSPDGHGDDDHH